MVQFSFRTAQSASNDNNDKTGMGSDCLSGHWEGSAMLGLQDSRERWKFLHATLNR